MTWVVEGKQRSGSTECFSLNGPLNARWRPALGPSRTAGLPAPCPLSGEERIRVGVLTCRLPAQSPRDLVILRSKWRIRGENHELVPVPESKQWNEEFAKAGTVLMDIGVLSDITL